MTSGHVVLRRTDPPVLVCADVQARHLGEEGVAGRAASRCLALLALWRTELWPVLHLKRIAQAAWFGPESDVTDWAAGFRPRPGELVFEHPLPSAYSSSRFAEYMASMKHVRCLMAGCSLDETILATVIEGFHRGHRFRIVVDAVTCAQPGVVDADLYRASMMCAIGKFAGAELSSELIDAAGSEV